LFDCIILVINLLLCLIYKLKFIVGMYVQEKNIAIYSRVQPFVKHFEIHPQQIKGMTLWDLQKLASSFSLCLYFCVNKCTSTLLFLKGQWHYVVCIYHNLLILSSADELLPLRLYCKIILWWISLCVHLYYLMLEVVLKFLLHCHYFVLLCVK
jgi:hypothetical protein